MQGRSCYTAAGAELDLVVGRSDGGHDVFEMKYGVAPKPERGFWNALDDLSPSRAFVVHAGEANWPLRTGVEARSALDLPGA